jgi:phage gp45-like
MWVWFPEGQEGMVATLRRATVLKTDDSGTQQILKKMTGLKSEEFEDVYRAQPHGFSSHAPSGSEGKFLALGGRSDRLLALGFEHKKHRPKDTPEGGTVIYNHTGDIIRVFKDNLDAVHSKLINIKIGKGQESSDQGSSAAEDDDETNISIVLKGGDSVTVTYDDASIKLESGKITHTAPHVVIKSDRVDLGDEGGDPVALCGAGCATKVFAV